MGIDIQRWKHPVMLLLAVSIPICEMYFFKFVASEIPVYRRQEFMMMLVTMSCIMSIIYRDLGPFRLHKTTAFFHVIVSVLYLALVHALISAELVGLFWTLAVGSAFFLFIDPMSLWQKIG